MYPMMALAQNRESIKTNQAVVGLRIGYGALYGLFIGVAFAFFTWAPDGYLISKSHGYLPWMKLLLGVFFCGLASGMAGWITVRFKRGFLSLVSWFGVSLIFAWLVIVLPLQVSPIISGWLNPQLKGLIHYKSLDAVVARFWLAFMWIMICVSIEGRLENVMVDSIMFSPTTMGRVIPVLICAAILGVCGTIVDGLSNEPLRKGVLGMDSTIQFVVDHAEKDVDKDLARVNHAGTLRMFTDDVSSSRKLFVSGYDTQLGEINVVVKFDNINLDCTVLYGQPAYCRSE